MAADIHVRLKYDFKQEQDGRCYPAQEEFVLVEKSTQEWWSVRRSNNAHIYLPANYLEIISNEDDHENDSINKRKSRTPPVPPPKPKMLSDEEQNAITQLENVLPPLEEPEYMNPDELREAVAQEKARTPTPDPDYGSCDSPHSSPHYNRREGSVTSDYRSDSQGSLDGVEQSGQEFPPPPPPDDQPQYANLSNIQELIHGNRLSQEEPVEYSNLPTIQLAICGQQSDRPPVPSAVSLPPTRPQQLKAQNAVNSFGNKVKLNHDWQDSTSLAGWTETTDDKGLKIYTNDTTKEKWFSNTDSQGKTYYYQEGSSHTSWQLPKVTLLRHNSMELQNPAKSLIRNTAQAPSARASWAGPIPVGNVANWKKVQPPIVPDALPNMVAEEREPAPKPEKQSRPVTTRPLDKSGMLNKTKIMDATKKVKKNWANSFIVSHANFLYIFKDQKAAQPQLKSGSGVWPSVERAEASIDLSTAKIEAVSKDISTRKNCYRIDTENGTSYLLQSDKESVMKEWYNTIQHNITLFDQIGLSSDPLPDWEDPQCLSRTASQRVTQESAEKTRIKIRLLNWLLRRPSPDTVTGDGIVKYNVFGSHIATICEREKTTVPKFVSHCILAVDKRGLRVDGIYRVNGNNAQIQKLRFKVDHNQEYNLMDTSEYDVHDITGALKLFFRELHEPLFPFHLFEKFMDACKRPDPWSRTRTFKEVVKLMPKVNRDTLKALLLHLKKVIQHSQDNRMQIQNIAIVFGPSLMWPAQEKGNIALTMVYQSQVLENLIYEYNKIFE